MNKGLILITGALGRIGSSLAAHWRDRECRLLDRPDGDLTGYDVGWTERFAGVGTVVHLAADPDPASPFESAAAGNIAATLNVLRASAEHGVARFIYASSVWADYERWRLAPTMTWYAASKISGEALVQAWADQLRRPAICLRFGFFDPAVARAHPNAETHRLTERALAFHLDEALAWSEPSCSVRYAIGDLPPQGR
ncbi:MAG: putative oxidoreductase protein [Enterovirga sp.]|nr:putative oxidoreductase protein [Enterovirga sp.]